MNKVRHDCIGGDCMKDRLKLDDNYIITNDCMELLKFHLCTNICQHERVKGFVAKGIDIFLNYPLKITYKNHYYWCSIVKDSISDNYYWFMRGYKSNFKILTDGNTDNFDSVLEHIISRD